jgi:hypothetical protein
MPAASDLYPQLESMDVLDLNNRYNDLAAIPDASRTDDHLLEMVSILGILRRKSAGPPKARRTGVAAIPSLDEL